MINLVANAIGAGTPGPLARTLERVESHRGPASDLNVRQHRRKARRVSTLRDRLGASMLLNRRLVRAPIWLYLHGLGWVLGRRVVMLEHVGRRSGRTRYVCLEVVERPSPGEIIIVSGFGERAHWYRNLRAHPDCNVSSGFSKRVPASARLMASEESAAALLRYQHAHPRAWHRLRGMIAHAVGAPVTALPMVVLSLEG